LQVSLKGTDIILVRANGNYYAAENHCPHSGGDISLGKLDGTTLTCPFHGSKFDLIDGRVIRWTDWTSIKASSTRLFHPIHPLTTYPVKIQGNSILVKI
ncbi:MAG: (2Fe-2S)-binding protein, partial [Chloroflexi bacterium RBG_13_46_9]